MNLRNRITDQQGIATLLVLGFMVLVVPGVVMWGGDLIGLASFAVVSDFLLSWEVIIGASVVIMAALWLVRRQ